MSNDALTKRWFEYPKKVLEHPEQKRLKADFYSRKYWHFTIVAGRRSFKTERFAKRLMVTEAMNNENHNYFLTAPTRMQAKDIFWKDVKELIPFYFISHISETELKITLNNGTFLKVAGMEAYKRIEGSPAHGICLSEYQETDPDAYNSIQPMIIDTGGFVIKEGRPIGKNHFFKDYMRGVNGEKGYGGYHWKSADILTPEQIEQAKKDLAQADFEREYEASFETGSNSPYYSYNNLNNNSEYQINSRFPLIVTCDFNATEKPMSWVLGQRIISGTMDVTYWLKCFSHTFTNTETMSDIVIDYLNTVPDCPKHLIFYGDYAGKQQKSNSVYSDWEIIRKKFRNFGKYEEKIKPCLSIRNSIASTNAQLCNYYKERKQFINPENCKALLDDWLECEWKDNSRELKDNDPLRGHCSRAVDYYNDYEHPIKGTKKTDTIIL